jgi:transglutaminase-like putative cysteine protease
LRHRYYQNKIVGDPSRERNPKGGDPIVKSCISWGTLGAAVLAAGLMGYGLAGAEEQPKPTSSPDVYTIPLAKRHFQFTYTATVAEFPKDAKQVDVWLPFPHDDANQTLEKHGFALEGAPGLTPEIATDPATGNKYAHVRFTAPFPSNVTLALDVEVTRREYMRKDFRGKGNQPLSDEERKKLAEWLRADKLVPTDGRIMDLAKQVGGTEKNVLNLGRRYYDHVLGLMRYDKSGEGWGRGDAVWACDSKYGNCTDFHALFIGLCRASGIPARFSIGFPIPEKRGTGDVGGYHCWAEFFVPGYGWVPVDISEADKHPELAEYYFGAHTEDRVEFTTGRDLMLVPPQKGEPLNFFVYPYAEADGKKWDGVKRKFAYKDIQ